MDTTGHVLQIREAPVERKLIEVVEDSALEIPELEDASEEVEENRRLLRSLKLQRSTAIEPVAAENFQRFGESQRPAGYEILPDSDGEEEEEMATPLLELSPVSRIVKSAFTEEKQAVPLYDQKAEEEDVSSLDQDAEEDFFSSMVTNGLPKNSKFFGRF